MNKQKGISQIIVMVVMLVLAIALPITTNLVKKSQENRSKATDTTAGVNCAALTYSECTDEYNANYCYFSSSRSGGDGTCHYIVPTSCSSINCGGCGTVGQCNSHGTCTWDYTYGCKSSTPTSNTSSTPTSNAGTGTGAVTTGASCSGMCYTPYTTNQTDCSGFNTSSYTYTSAGTCTSPNLCCTKTASNGGTAGSGTSTGSCTGTYHCVYSGTNNCAGYCIDACGNKDTSSVYDNCGSATTGTSYWYYTTAEVTLSNGTKIARGTCQETSNTYATKSDCQTSLNTSTNTVFGKTNGICYASLPDCTAATTTAGKPTITSATAMASGTSITVTAIGVSIDHAAVAAADKTPIGNMTCTGTTNCTYTITGLTAGTTYGYWVKTCSISTTTCPEANTAWNLVTATVGTVDDTTINIKMAFAGVKLNAKCAVNSWYVKTNIKNNVGNDVLDKVLTGMPTQTTAVNSKGDVIYNLSYTTSGISTSGLSNLAFLLSGEYHLPTKYGKNNQNAWYSALTGTLGLIGGTTNTYDFSEYPLLAGDVTGDTAGVPDGKINGQDFSYIKERALIFSTSESPGVAWAVGDINGDCQVNSGDVSLVKKALTEVNGQTY